MDYQHNPEQYFSSTNSKTLEAYENNVDRYIQGTPSEVSGDLKTWINASVEGLPENAEIFEIGSATGRDADYLEKQGFKVTRTDATIAFVEYLRATGVEAESFDILKDELPKELDLIFADAVFLHFTEQELKTVLGKAHSALKNEGRLAFTVKEGQGEYWSDAKLGEPRYFKAWQAEELEKKLEEAGFTDLDVIETEGELKWLHVIAKKPIQPIE